MAAPTQDSGTNTVPLAAAADDLGALCASLAAAGATTSGSSRPVVGSRPPRQDMFKNRGHPGLDQAERRRRELELQRDRRFNALALVRRLAEDDWTPGVAGDDADGGRDDDDLASVADSEAGADLQAEVTPEDTPDTLHRKRRPGRHYRNQLMLSEWLLGRPEGFEAEFLLKLCPQGKRVLVVAAKGSTKAFDRRGHCIAVFQSELPGGGRQTKRGLTILDCIWDTATFFAMDMMHWRDLQLYDTETTLRFHWLESNVLESLPQLHCRSLKNRHPFVIVQAHPCQRDSLEAALALPPPFPLDGALFYHRSAAYTFGPTALVGWLKPYMLTEVLGVPCHLAYAAGAPSDYAGCLADIERYEATRLRMAAAYAEERQQQKQSRKNLADVRMSPVG